MRQKAPITEDTPIRQLPYSVQKQISSHLDIDKQWERFVVNVPKRLQDLGNPDCVKRYSYLQVRLFDDKCKRPDGSPTRSILGKTLLRAIPITDFIVKPHFSSFSCYVPYSSLPYSMCIPY